MVSVFLWQTVQTLGVAIPEGTAENQRAIAVEARSANTAGTRIDRYVFIVGIPRTIFLRNSGQKRNNIVFISGENIMFLT
jgi:hypothetical protein